MIDPRLGYDPRPEVTVWDGQAIPGVANPLPASADLRRIAHNMLPDTEPWIVLRNATFFLCHVMDYATGDDLQYVRENVVEELWLQALEEAKPGMISRGSYVRWSIALGRATIPYSPQDWPDDAHPLDVRPQRNMSREELYRHHGELHAERQRCQRRHTD